MAFQGDPQTCDNDQPGPSQIAADQLTSMIITTGQRNFALNGAAARNQLASACSGLTLGVQQAQMASLNQLSKLSPLEAHAAAGVRQAQNIPDMAILRTGSRVPQQ